MIRTIFAGLAVIVATLAPVVFAPIASASTDTKMYVTGYDLYDNDPPGSKEIAYPRPDYPGNHLAAAGSGSYNNPVTVATGLVNGVPQFKPGTKIYIPYLQKYFRFEDSCADCGKGYNGYKWIDVWINGEDVSQSAAYACMDKLTGIHRVIVNPPNGYKLNYYGDISSKCLTYSDTLVLGPNT